MGVARNEHLFVGLHPFHDPFFDLHSFSEVLCRARWIPYPDYLKMLPEVPDKKPSQLPKVIIYEISLVPVNEKDSMVCA